MAVPKINFEAIGGLAATTSTGGSLGGGGGGSSIKYLVMPLYSMFGKLDLLAGRDIDEYFNGAFSLDRDASSIVERNTDQLQWQYQTVTVPAPFTSFSKVLMVETDTTYNTASGIMNYLEGTAGHTNIRDFLTPMYGDGTLDADQSAISANTLHFTPDVEGRGLSLLDMGTGAAFIQNATQVWDPDAIPASGQVIGEFQTMFHGIAVPLPSNLMEFVSVNTKKYGSTTSFGPGGKAKWDGLSNYGDRIARKFEFRFLSETERTLLQSIFEYLKGGMPVWYVPDLDDNETWKLGVVSEYDETNTTADFFNVNLGFEEL